MIKGSVWVVITTINPPRDMLRRFLDLGWQIVVVADRKTPSDSWNSYLLEGVHFFSLEDQNRKYPLLAQLIGENTYARKNLGYLYATELGAEVILDTDDDTFLRPSASNFFSSDSTLRHFNVSGQGWFNPYLVYAPESGLWPRGYPLKEVAIGRRKPNPQLRISELKGKQEPDILQTLVNLEPDVDSIYRMTVSDDVLDFPISNSMYHIEWPVVTPGNTQSTFWLNRKTFTYLYIPTSVSFRFTDILKMFIAQANMKISYGGFLTEQIRNPHDYMLDFMSEIQCFIHTSEVIEVLLSHRDVTLKETYGLLVKKQICLERELAIVHEFVSVMEALLDNKL